MLVLERLDRSSRKFDDLNHESSRDGAALLKASIAIFPIPGRPWFRQQIEFTLVTTSPRGNDSTTIGLSSKAKTKRARDRGKRSKQTLAYPKATYKGRLSTPYQWVASGKARRPAVALGCL